MHLKSESICKRLFRVSCGYPLGRVTRHSSRSGTTFWWLCKRMQCSRTASAGFFSTEKTKVLRYALPHCFFEQAFARKAAAVQMQPLPAFRNSISNADLCIATALLDWLDAQKPHFDALSGATGPRSTYMIYVYQGLEFCSTVVRRGMLLSQPVLLCCLCRFAV